MDKEIIFSVAGSGKTRHLIERLDFVTRTLIIVYTKANFDNITKRIIGKFGYIPPNIVCYTYFSFLFSWGIKPYDIANYPRIIRMDFQHAAPQRISKTNPRYYLYGDSIFHYRLFDFIEENNLVEKLVSRIERFFDKVFIDEVQDFAGNDFDFLMRLGKSRSLSLLFVGDFHQHIYDTSRNGAKNKNLHKDFEKYKSHFKGFVHQQLPVCYRCPEAICNFVSYQLGISLQHNQGNNRHVDYPRLIEEEEEIQRLLADDSIPKLVYEKSEDFNCNSITWGKSKGLEFDNVCVVLNKITSLLYKNNSLSQMKSLNKFYVACTRTKGNLYFIEECRMPSKSGGQMWLPI